MTEGLKREISEESGVIAEPVSLVGIYQCLSSREGYGPLKGITLPTSAAIDFICEYIGEADSGEGLPKRKWVSAEEARETVRYPVFVHRLSNMLSYDGNIVIASFERSPDDDNKIYNYSQTVLDFAAGAALTSGFFG